ncbi:MAG: hypothetical protein AAF970_16245 [Bacteroidota bacterium]
MKALLQDALSEIIQEHLTALLDERLGRFKGELKGELRAELMALHLGDDATVSEAEAADILGTSARSLRRAREAGQIEFGRLGKTPCYSMGMIRRLARRLATEEIKL